MKKNKGFMTVIIILCLLWSVSCTNSKQKASTEDEFNQIMTDDTGNESITDENLDKENLDNEITDNEITDNENIQEVEVEVLDLPSFTEYGVWYEIFVRSFADSDGDGIGDLKGIVDKLDYLTELGINGIWLMPINPSPSYHGYDVTDYYDVHEEYGTLEDFKLLTEEAHKRGIKVIMDLVINHSSSSHPWFIDAINDEDSIYRDYYRIVSEDDEGYNFKKQVWNHDVWNKVGSDYYYAIFWDQMPDLNYDTKALRDEMIQVGTFWLEQGIDGFRIDAVSHIFGSGELPKGDVYDEKSDDWWLEFNTALREVKPDYYLVGEAWEPLETRATYATYFDTTFDFDLAENGILSMVKNGLDFDGNNNGLMNELSTIDGTIKKYSHDFINGIFLTNHDMRRSMDYLNGDVVNMKLAATIYMTLPGNPFIYYGEEIGMTGNKPDERIREPFIWGEQDEYQTSWEELEYNSETQSVLIQNRIPDSLLNFYKEIIHLRQENPALLSGDFEGVETKSPRIVAYKRSTEEQELFLIYNLSNTEMDVSDETFRDIFFDGDILFSNPVVEGFNEGVILLPPKSSIIITINN